MKEIDNLFESTTIASVCCRLVEVCFAAMNLSHEPT